MAATQQTASSNIRTTNANSSASQIAPDRGSTTASQTLPSLNRRKDLIRGRRWFNFWARTLPQQATPVHLTALSPIQNGVAENSIWQNSFNDYVSRIQPEDRDYILHVGVGPSLDPEQLNDFMKSLNESYNRNRSNKVLTAVYSVMSHIQSFGRVIDSMVQSNPSIAGLLWGGARLLIEMCVRPIQIHENILIMLETLSIYLPLFETWHRLFPEASYSELSDCMGTTCIEFIAFIVEAVKFLRRTAFDNALRSLFLPSFRSTFEASERKIQRQTLHLKLQVQAAGLQSSESRHKIMLDILQSAIVAQPVQPVDVKMPFRFTQYCARNDNFFGREVELAKLHDKIAAGTLESPNIRLSSIVLHGLGGFGKSSIALEYMYRHYDTYPVIIWLYADKKDKLEGQFSQLARLLGRVTDGGNSENSREAVLHWITHLDVNWLMVYDNSDNMSLLTPFWPSSKHGSIVITSRNAYPGRDALATSGLQVTTFSVDQGAEFFLHFLIGLASPTEEDRDAAKVISQRFDGLPLAIRQAAYFMRNKRCLPAAFLELYNQSRDPIEQLKVPGYTKTVADVWEMSIKTLTTDAADLLDILTLLDPDAIPVSLFRTYGSATRFTSFLSDAMRYLNATERLSDQSLIEINLRDDTISLHRFFQEITFRRLKAQKSRYDEVYRCVVELVNLAVPEDDYLSMKHLDRWQVIEGYVAHAEVLQERSSEGIPITAINGLLALSGRIAGYFHETGQYASCESLLQKSKYLATNQQAVDNTILSKVYYYHGRLSQEINQPSAAIENFERATDLYEGALPPETQRHKDTYLAILYENLGMSCIGAERYEDAERFLEKAIEMARVPGAPTQYVLGDFLQCLGACYLWKGDLISAEDTLCRALLESCGANNENRGGALYSLGNVYLRQGRYTEALGLHQEVLELYIKDLGNMHHWVADSCHKIGSILAEPEFEGKNFNEAEKFVRRSLEIWTTLPNVHNLHSPPSEARSRWKLASILRAVNSDSEEGRLLHQTACDYVKKERGIDLEQISDPGAAVDSLVWYWSR